MIFDRMFRREVTSTPDWAAVLGDATRFRAFVEVVRDYLAERGHRAEAHEIATGSVMLVGEDGYPVEWILHEVAADCAAVPEETWADVLADPRHAPQLGPSSPLSSCGSCGCGSHRRHS